MSISTRLTSPRFFLNLSLIWATLFCLSQGEVIRISGGMVLDEKITTEGPANMVIDLGIRFPDPDIPEKLVLFETGSAGFGFVLALVDDNLIAYQDGGRPQEWITALVIPRPDIRQIGDSIRLDFDYRGELPVLWLKAEGYATALSGGRIGFPFGDLRVSGGGGTGVGGIVGSVAGQGGELSLLDDLYDPSLLIENEGEAVLNSQFLVGTIYTGKDADDRRLFTRPRASFYEFGEPIIHPINPTITWDLQGTAKIRWLNVFGHTDKVQYSTDLINWKDDLLFSRISIYGHRFEVIF